MGNKKKAISPYYVLSLIHICSCFPSFPGSRKEKSSITAETSAVILRSTNWKETEKR